MIVRCMGFIFFFISCLAGFSQTTDRNDTLLVIPLQTVLGIGKTPLTFFYFQREKFEELDKFGKRKEAYVFTHYYQPIQKHYREFLSGKIDSNKFNHLFKYYKSDSSELCPTPFKDHISVKVVIENDGFITVTPDQNNNGIYVDDLSFRIPKRKKRKDGLDYTTEFLPSFRIDNIYFYRNSSFIKKSAHFRISVYYNWARSEEMDSVDVNNIFFEGFEYKLGKMNLANKLYNLYVNNPVFDFRYTRDNTSLLLVEAEKPIPENFTYLIRRLVDTLSVDGYTVTPCRITDFGDSLYVIVSKTRNIKYGFHQGDILPNFIAETIENEKIEIYDQKVGSYLLIDFFGSWCSPCIANFPKLKLIHEEYSRYKFKIVGIANEKDSGFSALKKLVSKENLKWKIIKQSKNSDFNVIKMSKVHSYPTYLLISPDNRVLYECGGSDDDFKNLMQMLDTLLRKR